MATTGVTGISGSASAMLTGNDSRSAETSKPNGSLNYDVVVYGATSGGVIAAYTANMYGLTVFLVEPGRHLGGLSSGGLGATDTGGQEEVIAGMARDVYDSVGMRYGEKPTFRFDHIVAESI